MLSDEGKIRLITPGDRVVVFTDGLTESCDAAGEEFGAVRGSTFSPASTSSTGVTGKTMRRCWFWRSARNDRVSFHEARITFEKSACYAARRSRERSSSALPTTPQFPICTMLLDMKSARCFRSGYCTVSARVVVCDVVPDVPFRVIV